MNWIATRYLVQVFTMRVARYVVFLRLTGKPLHSACKRWHALLLRSDWESKLLFLQTGNFDIEHNRNVYICNVNQPIIVRCHSNHYKYLYSNGKRTAESCNFFPSPAKRVYVPNWLQNDRENANNRAVSSARATIETSLETSSTNVTSRRNHR
jgi:hypothetical protein